MANKNLISRPVLVIGTLIVLIVLGVIGYALWTLKGMEQASTLPVPGCTLKIVSSLPLQGVSAAYSDSTAKAIQLALKEHGASTSDRKCAIEYVTLDDSTATGGLWDRDREIANAKQAAVDPAVLAFIPFYSGAAKVSVPILNKADGLVVVSPHATYWRLTKYLIPEPTIIDIFYPTGVRNLARVIATDDIQAVTAARWYKNLGSKSVHTIDDGDFYGIGMTTAFQNEAGKIGLTVEGTERLGTGTGDYAARAAEIAGSGADSIYFGGTTEAHPGLLLKELRAAHWQGLFGTHEEFLDQAVIDEAGTAAEGLVAVAGTPPVAEILKLSANTKRWSEAYFAEFGSAPDTGAAFAYEAMNVVLAALDRCSSAGDDTRKCVRDAVFATKNYDGILGERWSFDANGDTSLTLSAAYKVENGAWKFVSAIQ